MNDPLELAVLAAGPDDLPDLTAHLEQPEPPEGMAGGEAEGMTFDAEAPDTIDEAAWHDRWGLVHDMAGGVIGMRTGAPCDLGTVARSAQGQIASKAVYELALSMPLLRSLLLDASGGMYASLIAIGMHGFACVQTIKASRAAAFTGAASEAVAQ